VEALAASVQLSIVSTVGSAVVARLASPPLTRRRLRRTAPSRRRRRLAGTLVASGRRVIESTDHEEDGERLGFVDELCHGGRGATS
jgi:hypothetical protein